ncbi:MAG: DUF11 domain-containing protein, partial [Thermoplasmata archaeon]|nr:DUF11 domain-containing protein [Thermoplasmata archaeon]
MSVLAGFVFIENDELVEHDLKASPLSAGAPPIPSTISLWEAWAKGFATIVQSDYLQYTVWNDGPSDIIIDEYVMLMSPSPANMSEDDPAEDDEAQDGILTITNTISPGDSLTFNYGLAVAYDPITYPPPPWWCGEDSESTNPDINITLGGEILPYDMIEIVDDYDIDTQDEVWAYMRDNATLVIGKRPLWKEIANIGDEVNITLEITNIGFYAATGVVVTDTISPGYSYDPLSFTHVPTDIVGNPDGSTTLRWPIGLIDAAVETPPDDPTDYTTVYIG